MLKWLLISYVPSMTSYPVGRRKEALTSIENNTPPIGEPKATATPAALAAVTISRIFPEKIGEQRLAHSRGNATHLGFVRTA